MLLDENGQLKLTVVATFNWLTWSITAEYTFVDSAPKLPAVPVTICQYYQSKIATQVSRFDQSLINAIKDILFKKAKPHTRDFALKFKVYLIPFMSFYLVVV